MEKKHSETSQSIARNVLYGFSTWILPLGLSFIATPIILKSLGVQSYGIYALVMGFVGNSFNFNFGRAITKYIAEYRATGENNKIPDVISSVFLINLLVGLTSVVVICVLAKWLVLDVFKIEEETQNTSITAFYVASLIIFVAMLNQIFTAILQGIHRFDIYSKIFNLNNIVVLSGNILLAYFDYGILSLLMWNLSVAGIICLIYFNKSKNLLPEFHLKLHFPSSTLKLILTYSSGIIGYQLLSNLIVLFERGWVTRKFGAENLTYYAVPMTLAMFIHGFIASLMIVIFPLASELKDNKEKLLRLYQTSTKVVCFLVLFMGTTIIVESREFLTLWLGVVFADKATLLLVIHTITFCLAAVLIVTWQMAEGLGYPGYNCLLAMIQLVVSVTLMIGLTDIYGEVGVAIGRMLSLATIIFSIFYVEKWFFGRVQREFWLKLLGVLAVSVIFSTVVEKLIISNFVLNWLTLALATLCGGIIYCVVLWLLGFVAEDEKLLLKQLLKVEN